MENKTEVPENLILITTFKNTLKDEIIENDYYFTSDFKRYTLYRSEKDGEAYVMVLIDSFPNINSMLEAVGRDAVSQRVKSGEIQNIYEYMQVHSEISKYIRSCAYPNL